MAYGGDVVVFVEDHAGDLGGGPSPAPWWLSPDVDIPAHPGEAVQGANDVQIRVHAHDEPILETKIVAEVYVGDPSLVLSPSTGTVRIDPGTLQFRTVDVPGSEPVANDMGATLTFAWTPSSVAGDVDGPGHRCLVVRAFPADVTPPTTPFDVPNEQHEAQHNIEILTTTTASSAMADGGAGTRKDPRRRDKDAGLWWERLATLAAKERGTHHVVGAFDPSPSKEVVGGLRRALGKGFAGFSKEPPRKVAIEAVGTRGKQIDPRELSGKGGPDGLGDGLFAHDRLLAAAAVDLTPRKPSQLLLRFDHSNVEPGGAVVMHVAQWSENGNAEGGMTIVALAPRD